MLSRVLLFALLAQPIATQAQSIRSEKISELHVFEAGRGHLVHSGKLFSGKIILNQFVYSLEAYEAGTNRRLDVMEMPHTVGDIYPDGINQIIVMGKKSNPWLTFATVVKFENGRLRISKTIKIPEEYQVDKMAKVDGKLFFNERGSRSIITKGIFGYKKLNFEISGPDDMVGLGEELWMIEGRGIGHGDESLSVYTPKTGDYAQVKLLNIGPRGISSLLALPKFNLLAIDDSVGGRVILIDPEMRKTQDEVTIGEDIRSLATYGSCIAALRTSAREIVWLKIDDSRNLSEIERWDIQSAGEMLRNPLDISVDESTGKAFVRAIEPCIMCDPNDSHSSVFSFTPETETVKDECQN